MERIYGNNNSIDSLGAKLWHIQEELGVDLQDIFDGMRKAHTDGNAKELQRVLSVFDSLELYNAEAEKHKRDTLLHDLETDKLVTAMGEETFDYRYDLLWNSKQKISSVDDYIREVGTCNFNAFCHEIGNEPGDEPMKDKDLTQSKIRLGLMFQYFFSLANDQQRTEILSLILNTDMDNFFLGAVIMNQLHQNKLSLENLKVIVHKYMSMQSALHLFAFSQQCYDKFYYQIMLFTQALEQIMLTEDESYKEMMCFGIKNGVFVDNTILHMCAMTKQVPAAHISMYNRVVTKQDLVSDKTRSEVESIHTHFKKNEVRFEEIRQKLITIIKLWVAKKGVRNSFTPKYKQYVTFLLQLEGEEYIDDQERFGKYNRIPADVNYKNSYELMCKTGGLREE